MLLLKTMTEIILDGAKRNILNDLDWSITFKLMTGFSRMFKIPKKLP